MPEAVDETMHTEKLPGREYWMGVLARARPADVREAWESLGKVSPEARLVRPAETGLVMVRGRAGGTGAPFNLGEMTVTRCTVEDLSGRLGHSYVQGRDKTHAEIAARLDVLLQDPETRDAVYRAVIAPLANIEAKRRASVAAKAAATKVDFFTLVRGE